MRVFPGHVAPLARLGAAAALCAALSACGGGGGSGGLRISGNELGDPVIDLEGAPGRFSLLPREANARHDAGPSNDDGMIVPPPSLSDTVVAENHYFRLEFPFAIEPSSLMLNDPLLEPFSYLNGAITVTDLDGNHIPGVAIVNGFDVFGVDRSADVGFPAGTQNLPHTDSEDRDPFDDDDTPAPVQKSVFVYIADTDEDLSTFAAFNPLGAPESATSTIGAIRINLAEINGLDVSGSWTINITPGGARETTPPEVLSIEREVPSPTEPANPNATATEGSFLVTFSEPVVPQSVGRSAQLNGFPFSGNKPVPPIRVPANLPLPPVVMTAAVNAAQQRLYIPFDCVPLNDNNLSVYRLTPLAPLPESILDVNPPDGIIDWTFQVRAFSLTNNTNPTTMANDAFVDLSGNFYDGPDPDGDGVGNTADALKSFRVGPGDPLVNIPVSPEVMYWIPGTGRGIGAFDLNGWGFTTNTPGVHADNPEKPAIVTNLLGLNTQTGIATQGHPCEVQICLHNQFAHPFGLGGFAYGLGITPGWGDPADPGNPGTPLPGANEMSTGFEEVCRNSNGDPILTGRDFSDVGVLEDVVVGEFLDMVYYDTQNFWSVNALHFSVYGVVNTSGRNVISDPPSPNPPPLRYWLGLPQIDIVVDVFDPDLTAFLIESDEVWTGTRAGSSVGQLIPNQENPFGPDQTLFPHVGVGPGIQSATNGFQYSSRQQIGNFLYVSDAENKSVHALNSNTMRIISSIELPDPRGLGIAPNNELLYVSNSEDDTLSVIDTNPMSPTFHTEIARVNVGSGPRAVSVQPDNEDVFVCNFQGNSISIIDQQTLTVRKEITALIDQPFDICLTGRQGTPTSQFVYGFAAGIFFGYVSNFGGNNLLVYESGPDGPQGIGHDNILGELPTGDADRDFIIGPRGLCYAPFANEQGFDAGGVFLAHQDDEGFGRVSLINFSNQAQFGPLPITSPPGFFIPPGFLDRNFDLVASWGNTDDNRLASFVPSDVSVADMDTGTYQANPSGAPNFSTGFPPPNVDETGFINSHHMMRCQGTQCFHAWQPDRLYVTFADSDFIQVLDPQQAGIVLKTTRLGTNFGTKTIASYWDQ